MKRGRLFFGKAFALLLSLGLLLSSCGGQPEQNGEAVRTVSLADSLSEELCLDFLPWFCTPEEAVSLLELEEGTYAFSWYNQSDSTAEWTVLDLPVYLADLERPAQMELQFQTMDDRPQLVKVVFYGLADREDQAERDALLKKRDALEQTLAERGGNLEPLPANHSCSSGYMDEEENLVRTSLSTGGSGGFTWAPYLPGGMQWRISLTAEP